MNPDDIHFHKDGKEFRVVDQYRRHNPDAQHIGKTVWFTDPGSAEVHIGKIVGVMPISYKIEVGNKHSLIIQSRLINSQSVIIPE